MSYILWTNDLSTGHARTDEDHRKLFGMINTLHKAMSEGRGPDLMGKALDALITYYKVHFRREEGEMLRIGYPLYLAHRLEHEKFEHEVDQLKKKFDSGTSINPIYVARMLSDWLRDHIVKIDTQLALALEASK